VALQTYLCLFWTDLTLLAIDPTQTTYAGDAGAFISFTVPLVIGSFDFCNNQLEGAFYPGWLTAAWPNIVSFSICNNKISGPIPSDLWSLPSPKLAFLDFSGNLWSGDFPSGTRQQLHIIILAPAFETRGFESNTRIEVL
jgi:hypothetical protein